MRLIRGICEMGVPLRRTTTCPVSIRDTPQDRAPSLFNVSISQMALIQLALGIGLVLSLAGCGLELLGVTAIRGEMETESLKVLKNQMDHAQNTTSDLQLEHTIQAYYAETGQYPPSLEALVPAWLPNVPTKPDGMPYGYNPATGQLLDGPMPVARQPGDGDAQKMAQIQNAITQYGMATGFYPETLQSLVPQYLASVPKTASGQDFVYNMQDGGLYHPNPAALQQHAPYAGNPNQPSQPRRATPGVAGGGPMGEVMTGIAIQQELNSMSNAGSSAAGSRVRHNAKNLGQNRDQQVNKQIQDLGL